MVQHLAVNPLRDAASLARQLCKWYRSHARDLPWRRTRDPYAIWISEIMLQQTTVASVMGYFARFMERFPDVESLAAAPEDDVLILWAGLGYYRRARMLHRAARIIVAEYGGKLPSDPEVLRRLPGVGRYTANAIASFAFGKRVPIVEANSGRVLRRLFGESRGEPFSEAELWHVAEQLLPRRNVSEFNHALMELGSLVCRPVDPHCKSCPVAAFCKARAEGVAGKERHKTIRRFETLQWRIFAILRWSGPDVQILLKRFSAGEWHEGLYGLPSLVMDDGAEPIPQPWQVSSMVLDPTETVHLATFAFTVTHHRVTAQLLCFTTDHGGDGPEELVRSDAPWKWVDFNTVSSLPLASPYRKAIRWVAQYLGIEMK